jgi:hypothetical protein
MLHTKKVTAPTTVAISHLYKNDIRLSLLLMSVAILL